MVVRAMVNVSLGGLRLSGGPLGALSGRMSDVAQVASSGGAVATSAVAAVAIAVGAASAAPGALDEEASAARVVPVVPVYADEAPTTTITVGETIVVDGVPVAELGAGTSTSTTSTSSAPGISPANVTTSTAPRLGTTTSISVGRQTVPTTTRPPVAAPNVSAPPSPTATTEAPADPLPPPAPPATTAAPTGPTPYLQPDVVSAKHDKDVSIDVLVNDLPLSGALDPATLTIVTAPNYVKEFRVHDDHLHYRSLKGFVGSDTLTYRVCDTSGACGTAIVTINVG
jgi:hypothetical protein